MKLADMGLRSAAGCVSSSSPGFLLTPRLFFQGGRAESGGAGASPRHTPSLKLEFKEKPTPGLCLCPVGFIRR